MSHTELQNYPATAFRWQHPHNWRVSFTFTVFIFSVYASVCFHNVLFYACNRLQAYQQDHLWFVALWPLTHLWVGLSVCLMRLMVTDLMKGVNWESRVGHCVVQNPLPTPVTVMPQTDRVLVVFVWCLLLLNLQLCAHQRLKSIQVDHFFWMDLFCQLCCKWQTQLPVFMMH